MPVYSASALTTRTAGGVDYVIAAFRSSTSQQARLRELRVFTETAPTTSLSLGLARSTAVGTGTATFGGTGTALSTGILRNPGDTAAGTLGGIVTSWATAVPTLTSSTFFEGVVLPAAVGAGYVWTFDLIDPLIIALPSVATGELVIAQRLNTATGTLRISAVWEE